MVAFSEFKEVRVNVKSDLVEGGIEIFAKVGGEGPGLLLLHGYPQTHHIWRYVAGPLSERYTVVCADLRGYGASSKPKASSSHAEYSKREMANDLIGLMSSLSLETFSILAHDRGARVAHRLALDNPGKVEKMVLLDIAPTLYMYEKTDMAFATGYWHWFFLIQPSPQTEDFILSDPHKFWALLSSRGSHTGVKWSELDVQEYQKDFFTAEGIHATCEDYRASATIDLAHDRSDLQSGNKLSIPSLKIIWGANGIIQTLNKGDVKGIWEGYCGEGVELSGQSLDCGHYIAEEKPEELLKVLEGYLTGK